MTTINDFATSYMNQSLPFGGVKESGFDRFAGVEGLRGVCDVKSICQDRSAARRPGSISCSACQSSHASVLHNPVHVEVHRYITADLSLL